MLEGFRVRLVGDGASQRMSHRDVEPCRGTLPWNPVARAGLGWKLKRSEDHLGDTTAAVQEAT